jgi:proliferating cell nuclear antigen
MSHNIVEIKTVQAAAFKILVEALKELLTETTIEFDETGIKIIAMDTAHVVLVHMKLEASKFEYYHCQKIKNVNPTIGVNMLNLHKLIKTINSNDILTLFIDANNVNHLGIKIENGEKNTKTTYKLDLLDLDNRPLQVSPTVFNSVITLLSSDFQKICRDMNNLADYVEIKNINNQLMFTCNGEFCKQETIISDNQNTTNGTTISSKATDEIVQGVYSLKYLVLFTKCTNLCNTVELYLKNDYPLIVKYNVASLGEIKLCLAPQSQPLHSNK